MPRHAIRAAACLALLGCADSTGPGSLVGPAVTVRTERAEYRPLELVAVTTTNSSSRTIWDDHCGGGMQGLEHTGDWNGSYGSGRACMDIGPGPADWRMRSVPIPPGGTHVDALPVSGQAYAGTWRVALTLRDDAGRLLPIQRRASNTFRVAADRSP